ncbi:MAG: 3-keto-disaccharide hydrolase [Chitinophagaceae bacterium]
MKKIIIAGFILTCFCGNAQQAIMKPLFNGNNLEGWYSFLTTKGKNNDPEKVFVIDNGLLHISGKEFGYICTEKTFNNFHLAAEFKWGEKKFPPRDADTTKRDNGICFYMPVSEKDFVWPKSIECQIQEGDVGDFWMIDSTTVVIDGMRTEPNNFTRAKKKKDGEKPNGEWNRVEIIADKGKITYIVNGIVVNEAESPSLSEGKILIQSEGAEIYYRKIEIAELK